jgi:hypothetical protein
MLKMMSKIVKELECPECGSTEFQSKPRRGTSRNIPCRCGCVLKVARLPNGKFWIIDIFPKGYRPSRFSMVWQIIENKESRPA